MKRCPKCDKYLELEMFGKSKQNRNGLACYCKSCSYIKNKEWRSRNRETSRACARRQYHKDTERSRTNTRARNRKRALELKNCPERLLEKRSKSSEWSRNKRQNSPEFKITDNLRNRVNKAIRNKHGSRPKVETMIGCSIQELKDHIESRFKDGMTWDNYGFIGWHIDHIRPCASFNLLDPEQQKQCFHYTNLQPLWANENLSKGSREIIISEPSQGFCQLIVPENFDSYAQ